MTPFPRIQVVDEYGVLSFEGDGVHAPEKVDGRIADQDQSKIQDHSR